MHSLSIYFRMKKNMPQNESKINEKTYFGISTQRVRHVCADNPVRIYFAFLRCIVVMQARLYRNTHVDKQDVYACREENETEMEQ